MGAMLTWGLTFSACPMFGPSGRLLKRLAQPLGCMIVGRSLQGNMLVARAYSQKALANASRLTAIGG